jgi:ATP-dependent helicase HrpB
VIRAARQLAALLEEELGAPSPPELPREVALTRALLAAYPDRVAVRRSARSDRVVLVGGRGARMGRDSAVRTGALLLVLDLAAGRRGQVSEAWIRLATHVDEAWLPAGSLAEAVAYELDAGAGRVVGRKRRTYRDLVVHEVEVPVTDPGRASRVLVAAAGGDLERSLGLDRKEVRTFLARLRNLAAWRPELELPRFDEAALRDLLPGLAAGRKSLAELAEAPLTAVLEGSLSFAQRRALAADAPERLEVPSGSRIALEWDEGEPPILAVRIQELFGLTETPRVAGGRVPVLLHLLAPNYRPQQVTDDLGGFWERTYPQVRKELAGRYPRHAWPQDPARAEPEAKGGRRGRA